MSRRTQRKSATAGGVAANSMAHRHLHLSDSLSEGCIRLGGDARSRSG
jgi:hypothetical protein